MLKVKPSQMRFRVDIQQKQRTIDANGITSETWVNVATSVPANVYALSGGELVAVAQTVSQYNARITIYKRSDINASMRIVFDGRNYDIKDIIPDPTNEIYTTLMCKTGFTNG